MAEKKLWNPSTKEQLAKVGSSKHLTHEELTEYFFNHKGIDEYFMREMARINHHIMKCESCWKLWETMRLASGAKEA